jgi:hypothetical protein
VTEAPKCWEVEKARHDEMLRWQWHHEQRPSRRYVSALRTESSWLRPQQTSTSQDADQSHLGGGLESTVRSVAGTLGGQVVAVVGDSLERQRFMSLACMLFAARYAIETPAPHAGQNPYSATFPELNLTVCYVREPLSRRRLQAEQAHQHLPSGSSIRALVFAARGDATRRAAPEHGALAAAVRCSRPQAHRDSGAKHCKTAARVPPDLCHGDVVSIQAASLASLASES